MSRITPGVSFIILFLTLVGGAEVVLMLEFWRLRGLWALFAGLVLLTGNVLVLGWLWSVLVEFWGHFRTAMAQLSARDLRRPKDRVY